MQDAHQVVKCTECGTSNRVKIASGKEAVCGRCGAKLLVSQSKPVTATDANFDSLVASNALILLDLWAPWCGPCRMIAPIIDEIASEMAGKALVAKLDVDENARTAARFRVQGIPTILIIKNGREVDRIVGAASRESILQRLSAQI